MKKEVALWVLIILVTISSTIFVSDGLTYLIASILALFIIGTIRLNRTSALKITRWGKANPRKTQVIITVLQLVLAVFGILAGKNFEELGYEFSSTSVFVFCTLTVIGFLSVHFLPKRRTIVIPKEVNKQRLAYIVIALSSFVMMTHFGNTVEKRYPNSPITHAINTIDQAIFGDSNLPYINTYDEVSENNFSNNQLPDQTNETSFMVVFASYNTNDKETITDPDNSKKETKAERKAEKKLQKMEKKKTKLIQRLKKKRISLAAGLTAGAVLLIILLVFLTCAGACLIVGGVAALIDGEILGILAIVGGVLLGWLSIREIGRVSKRDKQKRETKP